VRDQIRWRALDFEPAKAWKRVRAPVLALYGSNDEQIRSRSRCSACAFALSGNPDAQVKVLPGANHELQGNKEYPAVLFDWVVERVRR
jgi:pimeloyl-ACP methyl ester carboxylesterase